MVHWEDPYLTSFKHKKVINLTSHLVESLSQLCIKKKRTIKISPNNIHKLLLAYVFSHSKNEKKKKKKSLNFALLYQSK